MQVLLWHGPPVHIGRILAGSFVAAKNLASRLGLSLFHLVEHLLRTLCQSRAQRRIKTADACLQALYGRLHLLMNTGELLTKRLRTVCLGHTFREVIPTVEEIRNLQLVALHQLLRPAVKQSESAAGQNPWHVAQKPLIEHL